MLSDRAIPVYQYIGMIPVMITDTGIPPLSTDTGIYTGIRYTGEHPYREEPLKGEGARNRLNTLQISNLGRAISETLGSRP